MNRRLIIAKNPLEPDDYFVIDNPKSIPDTLMSEFVTWPDSARVYHKVIAQDHDVTPFDEKSIEALDKLEGDIFVVVYPEGLIGIIIAVIALVAITFLLKPKIPDINQQNREASSPNNELSNRSNRERINARIPDIYGQVRCFPDLIAPSYKVFESNREVEIAYMCVGQGEYLIEEVKDGDTKLVNLAGASAEFYGPNTSPNNGSPFQVIGSLIEEDVYKARRIPQVEGPELKPPGSFRVVRFTSTTTSTTWGDADIFCEWPDTFGSHGGYKFDGTPNSAGATTEEGYEPGGEIAIIQDAPLNFQSNDVILNVFAKYRPDNTIEWLGETPDWTLEVGDELIISNSAITLTKKPTTVSQTRTASYYRDGSGNYFIEFDTSEPVEDGHDYRTAKDFTLTENTNVSLNYDGTYTITGKTATTLTLDAPEGVNSDWNHLNGNTGYFSCTVGGLTRTVRFRDDNVIELQSGNFNDIDYPATVTTVTVSGANETLVFANTYQASAIDGATNRWQLTDPTAVTSTWSRLVPSANSKSINITVEQTHSTDTVNENFNGTYTIASMSGQFITLTNPTAVNSAWSRITDYVGDVAGFAATTDTFTVIAPMRSIDLSGTYTMVTVSTYEVSLEAPATVNTDWYKLRFMPGQEVHPIQPLTVRDSGVAPIGPFFIPDQNEAVYCNFYADNGLYREYTSNGYLVQSSLSVTLEVTVEKADASGNGLGVTEVFTTTLVGYSDSKNAVGTTLKCNLDTTKGPVLVSARRVTDKLTGSGSYVQTVKWRDCYGMALDTTPHYGAVTTVMTKTYATGNTLAIRERKFNCLVTRKIPYITGFTGTYPNYTPTYDPALQPTKDAAQIFCALSQSDVFGNRPASELDIYQIFETRDAIVDYFAGDTRATEFCFTFDNTNVSYEEAAQSIANAAFATAYRQGAKIKWRADIATQEPVLIFNHRNKLPGSESRTVRFENQNDNDSIQLEWVDPVDDSVQTFYIPEDQSGTAPKKIETIGIRNRTQAVWHAYRSWYRLQFQNTVVEFDTTQEAGVLIPKDIVLVADNTRAKVQDGEVWGQNVLTLDLSQEVTFEAGKVYTIFLQHTDGTVEAIPITQVDDELDVAKNASVTALGGFVFQTPSDAGLFGVGDEVVVGNATYTDPTNGGLNFNGTYTVQAVDNISGYVIFENPGLINSDWNELTVSTIGPRIGVTFQSSRYAKRRVNLQYATKQAISIDPENFSRCTYVIRANDELAPQLFQIQECASKDSFKYNVSAVNYDSRYYYLDDLQFWLNFDSGTFIDSSSRNHTVSISTAAGKATISADPERGNVHDNSINSSQGWVQSSTLVGSGGSYTKAVWVYQDAGLDAYFLSNANEQFRCNTTGRIIVGHAPNVTALTYPSFLSPSATWQHIVCTYDADLEIIRIYYNGILVAQKTGVIPAPSIALQPIGNGTSGVIASYCDDVRLWFRCFTPEQVLELYNSTKL